MRLESMFVYYRLFCCWSSCFFCSAMVCAPNKSTQPTLQVELARWRWILKVRNSQNMHTVHICRCVYDNRTHTVDVSSIHVYLFNVRWFDLALCSTPLFYRAQFRCIGDCSQQLWFIQSFSAVHQDKQILVAFLQQMHVVRIQSYE